MFALPLTSNLAFFFPFLSPYLPLATITNGDESSPQHVNYQLIPALHSSTTTKPIETDWYTLTNQSGAFDGLYAEWRQLSAEAFIRGEKWRRLLITTFWNAAVLMLAIVTPNITVAIEMLGKWCGVCGGNRLE